MALLLLLLGSGAESAAEAKNVGKSAGKQGKMGILEKMRENGETSWKNEKNWKVSWKRGIIMG